MAQAVASATNSAGTLVAAVLEAAGYAQQSRLLVDMQTWFQDMGAFAYVVAAIGAIVSVVLFGSYNMPRYFLLGPALFWFLIGPTRDVSEVTWKLGGGEARSIDGAYMEGLEEYKIGNSENGQEPTKVAAFFYYYTAFFSNLVNSVVDVILKFENDEDLMMIARTQALDMLLNIKPQRKELFEILHQTLYGKCDKMMQYAIALTSRNISDAVVKSLEERLKNTSSDDTEAYQSISKTLEQVKNTRASLQADYDYESFQLVEIDNPMQEFISTHYDKEHKYYGKNILTCGMVWDVAQTAVMEEAAWFVEKVEASHLKPPLDKNNKRHQQLLCYAIAKKLHSNFEDRNHEAGLNGECNLVEAAAIFLMRHTISDTTFSQVAQQIKNKAQVWKGVDDFVWLDDPDTSDSNRGFQLQPGTYMDQQIQHGVLVGRVLPDEYRNLTEEEREGKAREIGSRWRPLMHVEIGGFMDVSYNEQQRYRSLGIMQEIFSYAMHLPYWQGVILYLLGVSYPFLCPLVLLPNRALVILSLPLTWLWVKSWDIGFALVMILDKILWNLLPKSDLPYNPISDDSYSAKLPDMLEQALAVDPSYNLHVHYTFISMAMFAVPAITGYAILKGKSSVLASFTEGAADQGRDANPLAAGSYGAQIMNKRQQQMNEFGGAALLSHGYRGQGVLSSGSAGTSAAWGFGKAGAEQMQSFINSVFKSGAAAGGASPGKALNLSGMLSSGITGIEKGSKYGIEMLSKEASYAAYYASAYDGLFGRFGKYQIMHEAAGAAVDGSGSFEMNAFKKARDVVKKDVDRLKTAVEFGTDIIGFLLNNLNSLSGQSMRGLAALGGIGLADLDTSKLADKLPNFKDDSSIPEDNFIDRYRKFDPLNSLFDPTKDWPWRRDADQKGVKE